MEIAKAIGKKIRTLRLDQDLTREELSEQAGISSTFLGDIERGSKEPSLQTLVKLAAALKLQLRELVGVVENHYPNGVSKLELAQLLQPYLKERYTLAQAQRICSAVEAISAEPD